jgi:hypothetical protein
LADAAFADAAGAGLFLAGGEDDEVVREEKEEVTFLKKSNQKTLGLSQIWAL